MYAPDCVSIVIDPLVTAYSPKLSVLLVKQLVDPLAVVRHFHHAEMRIPGSPSAVRGDSSIGVQDVISLTTGGFMLGVCSRYVKQTYLYVFVLSRI